MPCGWTVIFNFDSITAEDNNAWTLLRVEKKRPLEIYH